MSSRTGSDDALAAQRAVEPVLHPEGWALLQSLDPDADPDSLQLGTRLRAEGHDAPTVAAVLTQLRLRAKARTKFGEFAESMVLTPHGIEQATRLPVAAMHARRFRDAGVASVADLGCGIGGDAMALAGLGLDVLAVDRDPVTVAAATVNLRPFPNARVELGDAADHDVAATEGIWLDPARRTNGRGASRRVHDPEEYEPPLSMVTDLADRLGAAHGLDRPGPVGAKLGPGIDRAALPAGTETQWLSWHGQVLEAVCWFGPLARAGVSACAVVVDDEGAHRLDLRADSPGDPEPGPVGPHIYEPDGAVIRAGLLGTVAQMLGAHTVDPTIAYLTGPEAVATPFARGYEVLDALPFSVKRLNGYLREHGIGVLEIKKRGTAVEPEELRRKLRPRRFGAGSATLILTRVGGEQQVIVARPHPRGEDAAGRGQRERR